MHFSQNTKKILANFAGINNSIILRAGSQINCISIAENIFASAQVEEEFPVQVGIYSISEFLKALSLFSNADVDMTEKHALMSEGRRKLKYSWSAQEIIKAASENVPQLPVDVEIVLSQDQLKQAMDGAGALALDILKFESDGTTLKLTASSSKNVDSNTYELEIGPCSLGKPYHVDLAVSNLKLIPGDYKVGFAFPQSAVLFNHASAKLMYLVAAEKSSVVPS